MIEHTTGGEISPNGKFLLPGMHVIPLEGGDPIKLVDFPAYRGSWSPNGKMIAFYSGGIWVIPVSPETGQPMGPAKKLLDGNYWYQFNVQWSPDSDKIVFLSPDLHLCVLSVKDGTRTQITQEPQFRIQGSWSPDGNWIVCNKADESIWLVPVNGGKARKLVETQGRTIPYWSSDGKWIFYQRGRKLHFVRVSDAFRVDVTFPEEIGSYLSWSPDGRKMFFCKSSSTWTDSLKIVPSSGGEPFEPAKGLVLSGFVQQWSADSKFVLTFGKHGDYLVVPIAGDDPFRLRLDVSIPGELEHQALSPDIKKLVFSSQTSQEQERYWVVPVSLKKGRTTGPARMIFDKGKAKRFHQENTCFRWSPDGTKLALICQKKLWIARTNGSPPVQLTRASEQEAVKPKWSPDGNMISWISYSPSSGKSILRVRRLSKDEPRNIAETSKWLSYKWSPDGSRIAYEFYKNEADTTHELFVVSDSGGESKKLIEMKQDFRHKGFNYAWCPRGDKLAVLAGRKILAFRFPGGERQQVGGLIEPLWGRCFAMKWSPDGQRLALIMEAKPKSSDPEESGTKIFTVNVPEGKWTELAGESGTNYFLYWSPDGKWISYNSESYVKTRPERVIWEVEIDAYLKKMAQRSSGGAGPSAD